ncbi:hypothetical protein RRG08_063066 [Elysia crispata]|uniref:Uncharacterized protein n=1 Tax=Elysia crispata TaxID=231223 RepID=A0AAE1DQP4_9GAST|nr:hypothetical protein RRG08_063066 [Elysia crispata]
MRTSITAIVCLAAVLAISIAADNLPECVRAPLDDKLTCRKRPQVINSSTSSIYCCVSPYYRPKLKFTAGKPTGCFCYKLNKSK